MALSGDASASQIVKAVRYAPRRLHRGRRRRWNHAWQSAGRGDPPSVRHTLTKASALGAMVTERRFKLVYQPVVALSNGALHHHEVLVRFGEEESPFPMIRMARSSI
ncbi:MAG: hypothetical protein WDM85_03035 [Caulobacteraceae bacterium]